MGKPNVPSLKHDVDPKMQAFLDMIAQRKVEETDPLVVKLKKRMTVVKRNRKWRSEYMRRLLYEMDQEARERRIQEGERKIQEGERRLQEGERRIQDGERKIKEKEQEIYDEQENLKERNRKVQEEEHKLSKEKQRLQENQQNLIEKFIEGLREYGVNETAIKEKIKDTFSLSDVEIKDYFSK